MKVLITGGCGFIGSHVADAYLAAGHEVVVVDNLSTGKVENRPASAALFVLDICTGDLKAVFEKERPDIVCHHAAQISVPQSVREPLRDAEVNIKGTIRVLDAAKEYGAKKVIFASSGGAIYGEAAEVPTTEAYMPEPVSPYAISKLSAERYIQYYNRQYNLAYVILRYSNVYGPRQIRQGEAGVVAIFAESLLQGTHPVLYHFGADTKGMIRDYCYVRDIARANLLVSEGNKVGIFNIGTGKGTTTLALYKKIINIIRISGKKLPAAYNEPLLGGLRAGDIPVSTLSIEKAHRELGWQPVYDMDHALSETINWYRENEA